MTLKELFQSAKQNWCDTRVTLDPPLFGSALGSGGDSELTPRDFLDFARKDLQADGLRGGVNAIGNAKRAIDAQIDKFLVAFGLSPSERLPDAARSFLDRGVSSGRFADAPEKLHLLDALGVAPLTLASAARAARHALEHRYELPDEEEVQSAIETAALFLGAVDNVLDTCAADFFIDSGPGVACVSVHFREGIGYCFEATAPAGSTRAINLGPDNELYYHMMRFCVAIGTAIRAGGDAKPALLGLLGAMGYEIPPHAVRLRFEYVAGVEWLL